MRALAITALAMSLSACSTMSWIPGMGHKRSDEADLPRTPEALVGTWNVSLFFSPNEGPSETTLVITSVEDGALTGSFYDTPFSTARITDFDGEVLFSAVTQDGSGPYIHSARVDGPVLRGQTLSVGRDFLMPWTAKRADD